MAQHTQDLDAAMRAEPQKRPRKEDGEDSVQEDDDDRTIYFCGDMYDSDGRAGAITLKLLELELAAPGEPIKMIINSNGAGTCGTHTTIAMTHVMRLISSPVHTVGLGRVSGMAAVVFAAGEESHRKVHKSTQLIIHELRSTDPVGLPPGSAEESASPTATLGVPEFGELLEQIAENKIDIWSKPEEMPQLNKIMFDMIAKATSKQSSAVQVETKTAREGHLKFSAEEAVAYGLADGVISQYKPSTPELLAAAGRALKSQGLL